MPLTPAFWSNLILAIGLGLAVALLLWLFRRAKLIQRVRVSALLTALALGAYLVLTSLNFFSSESLTLRIVFSLSVLLAANTLLQIFDWVAWDYVMGVRRHIAVPRLLIDLFNLVVLLGVAFVLLRFVFGVVDLSGLLFTSTVLSAVIGLALQDTLGNIITGLALQLERPFTVGDWVKVNDLEGEIIQMSWRTVTLRTRDDNNIFLPNGNVAKDYIVNYSRPTPLQRMHALVGVAYAHPPALVKPVLAEAMRGAPGVSAEPPPQVVIKEYGDFAVQYDLLYWITDFANALTIHDEVMTRVWYALRRAHFAIPFPARDVTVRMLSDDHEDRAQAQQQRAVFATLRPLSIFAPLNDAQVEQLAGTVTRQRYTTGEYLVRQGEAGDSLFVIAAGQVRIERLLEDGQVIHLDTLNHDEFFGEMSLLTGEPRSASVIAQTDTEVMVVSKAGLSPVIGADGRIAEAFSLALMKRTRRVEEAVAKTGPLNKKPDGQAGDILARIRRFFGVG
jgi:small-conductance mechanosensitive channel